MDINEQRKKPKEVQPRQTVCAATYLYRVLKKGFLAVFIEVPLASSGPLSRASMAINI